MFKKKTKENDLFDAIEEAKQIIGDEAAEEIANYLGVDNLDEAKMRASCPWHSDSNPSLIWDKKRKYWHCFSCQRTYSILDMYVEQEGSFIVGARKLLQRAGVDYNFKDKTYDDENYFENYIYPREETNTVRDKVEEYLGRRGISKETLDYADIKQDNRGNIVFESRDRNGRLLSVKYRKSGKVRKGEPKMWYQTAIGDGPKPSNCPILWPVLKIDVTKPLVVTEGECCTGDTEVLTPEGWVRLDQYDGQQVMQVNEDMSGSFVTPLAYVKHEYDGDMYYRDNRMAKLAVTANHNMVYIDYKGRLVKKKACEMPKNIGAGYIPIAINYDGPGIPLTDDQIALYIAVCADCTIDIRKTCRHSRFGVKKDRKYIRMKEILDRLGIKYFDNPDAGDGYKYLGFRTPDWIKDKRIPQEWVYQATLRQKKFILDELIEWDGNHVANRNQVEFNSAILKDCEVVQQLSTTCGYGSSIYRKEDKYGLRYRTNIRYGNTYVTFQAGWDKIEHYNGMVYCVTVPTGMILIRYKGRVSVCGNCDALSVMEAGEHNVVSIPHGSADTSWINFNFEFLEQFETIILWFDNDSAGQSGLHNIVKRLGEYRCKIVKPGVEVEDAVEAYYQQFGSKLHIRKTDANNVLLACGKEKILQLINTAEEIPVKNISYLMDAKATPISDMEKFPMGIKGLDDAMYGNIFPALSIYSGSAGCVDCDTEFFNGTEWKRIANYQPGDKVLQYNEDGTATLVEPEQYHKYSSEYLWHFKTKYGIDQCLSDEHNVPYITSKGNLNFKRFSELKSQHETSKNGFMGKFITSFEYSGTGIDLTDSEIKLMCAIICDGSFYNNKELEKYKHRNSFNTAVISLKKERKKEALRSLLSEGNFEWRETNVKREGYTSFYVTVPRREKVFGEYWYNCNRHQLQVICDNILFWDGHEDGIRKRFFTNVKENADFIQFAFTSCGYRAAILTEDRRGQINILNGKEYVRKSIDYTVNITKRTLIGIDNCHGSKLAFEPYKTLDGFKYCFTVPSHMWVMRRNGRICVTGNSGKSSLTGITTVISALEAGEKVWIMSAELPAGMLADWILAPLAGYNHTMEFDSDMYERKYYRLTDQAEAEIRRFYRENILLYNGEDSLETSADDVLDSMEVAYKKFGCRVFLVDNLMSISLDGLDADSKWEAQKKFIVKLANFTNKYGVNVNLVAHPRKPASNNNNIANNGASVYDIAGSSDLGNLCHRMIWISRIKDDTMPPDIGKVKIEIVKDRPTQSAGMSCEAFYDKKTRRIYTNDEEKYRKYSWELNLEEEHKPIQYNAYVEQRLICNKKQEDTLCDQF